MKHETEQEKRGDYMNLMDGEKLNQEHPDTFYMPPREDRENVDKGDLVKMIFTSEVCGGERMWVIVTSRAGDGFTGILDNDPFSIEELSAGAEVKFGPEHIIEIYDEESEAAQTVLAEIDAEIKARSEERKLFDKEST